MNLIPEQYHELETICNALIDNSARCVTFISLTGSAGSSTACASVAKRLQSQNKNILIIDLNPLHSFKLKEQLPQNQGTWRFDDISCQLSVIPYQGINILPISNIESIETAKNKHTLNDAILRLKQEYDYVFLDMSPTLRLNRNNVPLHSLSLCSDLTLLTVALGINDEEELCKGVSELKQAGHKNIQILISQNNFAPLGERMLKAIDKRAHKWPRFSKILKNKISKQTWLFQHH